MSQPPESTPDSSSFNFDLERRLRAPPSLSITAVSSPMNTLPPSPVCEKGLPSLPVAAPLESGEAPKQSGPPGPPGPPGGWLAHKMNRRQEAVFNFMVCMVQLIPQACLTTCFPIIQIISADFHIEDPAVLPWVVAAYALSFGTTILLAGRLGDIFGHKNIVVLGFAWLAFWSVVAGLSRYATCEFFFVSRAMQGLGSAMMNPNALAILGRSYPPGSKGKIMAFSAFGLCAPLGAYTGMVGSAVIGQLAHWSWCFYTLAITSVVLGTVAAFVLPSPPKTPKQMLPFTRKLGQMDWLGGFTGVSGLVAIQVALISAPVKDWKREYVFMLLILGVVFVAFFITVELRVSTEPLIPFKLLNANVAFVLGAVACGWGTFGVWTFYLWRFLLGIWHDTPLLAALHVLPIVPVALIAAALTAVLMRKTQPAWILLGALIAFTLGPMFLSFNQATSNYWTFTFLSLLVTPFGMDMSFPSATFIMSNSLPMDKQGVAGSLVTTVVNYSISLGLGIASSVEVHVNDHGHNVMNGLRGSWYFGIGLGGLGVLICAIFVAKCTLFAPSNPSSNMQPVSYPLQTPGRHKAHGSEQVSSTSSTIASVNTAVESTSGISTPAKPSLSEERDLAELMKQQRGRSKTTTWTETSGNLTETTEMQELPCARYYTGTDENTELPPAKATSMV